MFLLFSRPIEFLGIPAFLFILTGFGIVSVVGGLLLLISLPLKNETTSKSEEVKSWLAGGAVMGAVFLIVNLILAVPAVIFLFFVQMIAIEPAFGSSDQTFHKIDNSLTFLAVAVNLVCYFWAITKYHQKIYNQLFNRPKK